MFPIVVVLWLIAWSVYFTGSRKYTIKPRRIFSEVKEPTFTVLMSEEMYATQ
jgi:hypothetical protein